MNTTDQHNAPSRFRLILGCLIAGCGLAIAGCQQVPVYQQVELSRPGMLFSDSPALADSSVLLSTIEPGTDDRGGANAAGCTACQ
ncbi:MAG: hypothetical protein AB3N64_03205 [Puniceicoccaceae bacterium]